VFAPFEVGYHGRFAGTSGISHGPTEEPEKGRKVQGRSEAEPNVFQSGITKEDRPTEGKGAVRVNGIKCLSFLPVSAREGLSFKFDGHASKITREIVKRVAVHKIGDASLFPRSIGTSGSTQNEGSSGAISTPNRVREKRGRAEGGDPRGYKAYNGNGS